MHQQSLVKNKEKLVLRSRMIQGLAVVVDEKNTDQDLPSNKGPRSAVTPRIRM